MSADLWAEVALRMDEHGYMHGVERTVERVRATGEVFTPTPLVIEMLSGIPLEEFAPGRTILDPACGDGQFLVAAKWIKVLAHGMSEADALADLYGVDIMRDNVDLCRRRLGGGTIVIGNTLDPAADVEGQTEWDRTQMRLLFAEGPATKSPKKRPFQSKNRRQRQPLGQVSLGFD